MTTKQELITLPPADAGDNLPSIPAHFTAAALEAMFKQVEAEVTAEVPDVETPEGRARIKSMAAKVAMLVKRLKLEPDVVLTGGGGEDEGLVEAIGTALRLNILVPDKPRLTAAFGAACLAAED